MIQGNYNVIMKLSFFFFFCPALFCSDEGAEEYPQAFFLRFRITFIGQLQIMHNDRLHYISAKTCTLAVQSDQVYTRSFSALIYKR